MTDEILKRKARSRTWRRYVRRIGKGLDKAFDGDDTVCLEWDVNTIKAVVFSDLHKGARNRADDFERSERAFLEALSYYYDNGYTLVLLGDVEELWEEKPKDVLNSYSDVLKAESKFVRAGRYIRLWGNHDDDWDRRKDVESLLIPRLGPLEVHEAVKVTFKDNSGSQPFNVGTLFLAHGHQGTHFSDKRRGLSRWVVRYIWRNFQRLTNWSLNTPSKDEALKEKHDIAMYTWALDHPESPILVAGHTHHPVFLSTSILAGLRSDLARLSSLAERGRGPADVERQIAEIELRIQQAEEDPYEARPLLVTEPMKRPCYMNAGGCCFTNGEITGIEVADGQFKHVRWRKGSTAPDTSGGRIGIPHAFARLPDPDQW